MSLCCGLPETGPLSREERIAQVLLLEWAMFHAVPNVGGGRASCQEDRSTFEINRGGQFESWSDAALNSYLTDLQEAQRDGRNLLTEKYARMMEATSPEEYAKIAHLLPPLDPEAGKLIEDIVEVALAWEEALAHRYPYVLGRGRPIRRSGDSRHVTSVETYLRGELATYSVDTLRLYADHVRKLREDGENGSERILDYVMKRHGFASLEEANQKLGARV
jgi:hypothetical protein